MLGRLGGRELFGLAVLVVWVGWAGIRSALAGQALSPLSPYVAAPLSLAVGVALGALLAPYSWRRGVTLALLGATLYLLVAVLATGGPAKSPTGYANANAALAVQLIGLSGLALLAAPRGRRWPLVVAAISSLGVTVANASVGAIALGGPLLALVLTMRWKPAQRHTGKVVATGLSTAAMAVSATAVMALATQPSWPRLVLRLLDEARHTMWGDAVRLWREHAAFGAGPGAFERISTLGHDPDTASAHSVVLQVGAETGWVGVALLLAIGLTGSWWASQGRPASAVVGVATWTALVVHSMTDHLVDFPLVVLAGGIVLGWSGASGRSEQLDVSEGQPPR
ncbi:O-antigen ligase family protein [Intrasporangium sp. DVR]|uniref:O-antigen ligase family protein n=1 Tax=Intrasporangium sp. DVR TaxID=3127867 RepID=UPI00313A72C9